MENWTRPTRLSDEELHSVNWRPATGFNDKYKNWMIRQYKYDADALAEIEIYRVPLARGDLWREAYYRYKGHIRHDFCRFPRWRGEFNEVYYLLKWKDQIDNNLPLSTRWGIASEVIS